MEILAVFAALAGFSCVCLVVAIPLVKRHSQAVIQSPSRYGLPFEEIGFLTRDKIQLNGWWIPSVASTRTIIFLHGYAGSMDPDLKYVLHLNSAGFNILMFDFRAHGRSEGNLTSLGLREVEDVRAAVNHALLRGSTSIGLLGFSMGGRAALLAFSSLPAVKAVVADSAPVCLLTAINSELRRKKIPIVISHLLAAMVLIGASLVNFRNLFSKDVWTEARKISIPVMLLYGGRDKYVTRRQIDHLQKTIKGRVTLHYQPEAAHRGIDDIVPDQYMQWLLDFYSTM